MIAYYQKEKTKIFKGDCLEIMDEMIQDHIKFDFVFTSPPYNRKQNDKYKEYNDNKKDYYSFLVNVIERCLSLSDYVFFNIQQTSNNKKDVHKMMGHFSDNILNNIIWSKSNPSPSNHVTSIINSYEYILILSKTRTTAKATKMNTRNLITTNVYSNNPYSKIHGAVMHPKVAEWFIDNFTNQDSKILDPFMGTGTTLIESAKAGRGSTGIELSETYCKIAIERLKTIQIKLDI